MVDRPFRLSPTPKGTTAHPQPKPKLNLWAKLFLIRLRTRLRSAKRPSQNRLMFRDLLLRAKPRFGVLTRPTRPASLYQETYCFILVKSMACKDRRNVCVCVFPIVGTDYYSTVNSLCPPVMVALGRDRCTPNHRRRRPNSRLAHFVLKGTWYLNVTRIPCALSAQREGSP